MKITCSFPKPATLDLTDLRARVDSADLGTPHRLFLDGDVILVEVDDSLTREATSRLREAVEGYVYTPRAFVFAEPVKYRFEDLDAVFRAAGVAGFSGLTSDGIGNLRAEFPDHIEPFDATELAALNAALSGYTYVPTWTAVRAEREPLLAEADHRINTLEDDGEDATAWRAYRKALRDVTKGDDPENPVWPVKP